MPWVLFSVFICALIIVLFYYPRCRRENEPPLDKGFIPWLGHALAFQKDVAKFLSRMKEKHGDVFTLCVAGHYVTVLMDPHSFDEVLNDDVHLDFSHSRQQLIKRVFGLQLPGIEPAAEKKFMEAHFRGVCLSEMDRLMSAHLQEILLEDLYSQSQWKQEGLFSLCYRLLFRAGYLTLFESTKDVAAVYKEFRKFDHLLSKLARRSLKGEESEKVHSSRERLWQLLSLNNKHSGDSKWRSWQRSYQGFLQEQGVDAEMQRRALLLQLWTTQCNAGPAAFWLLGFLLTHPKAMEEVQTEIKGLSLQGSSSQCSPSMVQMKKTPVLDSVLKETLRLTAAAMISRDVVQHKVLHMANGQEYYLRRGDKVCLFPFLSPQMDPEIHQEPHTFKYDRFLNADLTARDDFYKDGRRLKYFTMPWGAGSNVCVGKDFAMTIIKKFVLLMLTHVELKICDREAQLPPVNSSRYGFGMLQPDGDLQVCYRLKTMT
ncbi:prostacyclin synthase isoform X2 [Corythoichthys intestinalis]|uniref:prostacyclin synthase isoform X2 n=1 Tax=Corythoichthys intestinalis TaxID=161448 RepID=UPI0025A58402|nr:prostacyclin synthase isoform X2 [Corythoichthys intestinalis]